MWVSREKFELLETKIAALEKEQLAIERYVKNNIASDQELIEIVKKLREELLKIKISYTHDAEKILESAR